MTKINFDKLTKICETYGAEFTKNAPLAPFTSFRIGGPADVLVRVNGREIVGEIAAFCAENALPCRVIGNGSNLLVSDVGVRGVVLVFGAVFSAIGVTGEVVHAEAGASLGDFCTVARDNSLGGAEFAYGIPGSVGGAVYMNAGAFGGEIAGILQAVEYLNEDCEIEILHRENADFSYRKSPFMQTKNIIISAEFKLTKGDKSQITAKMDDFLARRGGKQPLEFPSAGSTFKRPEGDYASRLIDVCGLKGFAVGGAAVSEKHAGFVINKGGATCDDVLRLIDAVRERVFRETGIALEREVELFS
ncbi:MAG: UDP-N-acetylmuramate dehydrogenase [Oscillospiraceae bacterium]|nr:UDP-N-acetylmuramate dehydrogenase [Oscillospiraceae bacterium]